MFKKIIKKGEKIPSFYGISYRSSLYNKAVCYPIPLNLLMRWWKGLKKPKTTWWEKQEKEIKAKVFRSLESTITGLEFENMELKRQIGYLNCSLSKLMENTYADIDVDSDDGLKN